jgi:hypothetical protein
VYFGNKAYYHKSPQEWSSATGEYHYHNISSDGLPILTITKDTSVEIGSTFCIVENGSEHKLEDGSYQLEDGRVIVIVNSEIKSITPPKCGC